MSALTPPHILLTWSATALGSAFGGYKVYRRPARGIALAWTQIGGITVPSGYTPANVEAQHNSFRDFTAGWPVVGGQYADGYDYAVSVISTVTNTESPLSTVQARIQQLSDFNPWVVSNVAPFYNFPITSMQRNDGADESARTEFRIAGRDLAVARTQLELPPRDWTIDSRVFNRTGEDQARVWRAAAASGLNMAVHEPRGDRLIGVLEAPSAINHEDIGVYTYTGDVLETSRDIDAVADFNLSPGLVTDGAASYVSHADSSLLDPGTGDFTIFCYALFVSTASRWALAKLNAGQGYGIVMSAGPINPTLQLVHGAGPSSNNISPGGTWNDTEHSFIATVNAAHQAIYQDGVLALPTSIALGAITNSDLLTVGCKSSIASFAALTPVRAYGYYPRVLSQLEITNLHNYLHGVPGVRPPAGASLLVDFRDNRTWDGTQSSTTIMDLSGNGLNGTLVGSPVTRGIPWALSALDRF